MGRIEHTKLRFITVGQGVYTLAEAEHLSGASRHSIARWIRGYTCSRSGKKLFVPPIIGRAVGHGAHGILSFADLIELRFLNEFRQHGVSSKALRIAAIRAQELLGRPHPFSTQIFKTDGKKILAEIVKETGDKVLLDIVRSQYAFSKVISPYLYKGLDFNQLKEPERWWPLGKERSIVIDPQRSFGAPITARTGIPTRILSHAFKAEGSIEFVSKWFNVDLDEVKDALAFESQLAA